MPQKTFLKIWIFSSIIIALIVAGILIWRHSPQEKLESPNELTEPKTKETVQKNIVPLPRAKDFLSPNAELLVELSLDFDGDGQNELVFIEQVANWKFRSKLSPYPIIVLADYNLAAGGGPPYTTSIILLKYNKTTKTWERSVLDKIEGSRIVVPKLKATDLDNNNKKELFFTGGLEGTGGYLMWGFYAKTKEGIKKISLVPDPLNVEVEGFKFMPFSESVEIIEKFLVYHSPLKDDRLVRSYPAGVAYYKFDGSNLINVKTVKCISNQLRDCIQANIPLTEEETAD